MNRSQFEESLKPKLGKVKEDLQSLREDLGHLKSSSNEVLGEVKKGIDVVLQEILDLVREFGNRYSEDHVS